MKNLPERSIALSHTKATLLLIAALIFVAIGMWLILMPQASFVSKALGGVGIVFFGACGVVAFKKLMQRGAGLIISAKGVHDQSSGTSAGFVPWKDVSAVQSSFVSGQKFVSLMLHDAQEYAQRGNALQQRLAQLNMSLVGTSINISANTLKISFDELLALLQSYHRQSQER
jgi:hypothetical protein